MSAYVSITGWVACDDTRFPVVQEIIQRHFDEQYSGGWTFPSGHMWSRYVCYGGDVRADRVDWFLDQLHAIAVVPPGPDGPELDDVRGLFLAHHETDGRFEWHVRRGEVVVAPGDERHRFLDA